MPNYRDKNPMTEGLLKFEFISYTVHLPLVLPLKPDSTEDVPLLNQQEAQKSACPQEVLGKGRWCFHTAGPLRTVTRGSDGHTSGAQAA